MTNYPTMGELWPRQGFTSINADQCALLSQALIITKPERPTYDVRNEDLFATHCNKWAHGSSHNGQTTQAIIHAASFMDPTPAFQHLSVSSIHCNLTSLQVTEVTSQEAIWRWPYYPFAYSVYWALLFHESNAMLQHPDFLSQKILRLWSCLYKDVDKLPTKERRAHLLQIIAALFERTLGAQTDIREERQCFVLNIADRRELGRRAKNARVRAFTEAVEFLLEKWRDLLLCEFPQ